MCIKRRAIRSLSFSSVLVLSVVLLGGSLLFGSGVLVQTLSSAPVIGWMKTYDFQSSTSYLYVYANGACMVQASDGGYVLAGNIYQNNGDGASSGGVWLVKTGAGGNAQWNKTYLGEADYSVNAVVRTSDGGFVLAGQTAPRNGTVYDFWLFKIDSSGNLLWSKTYGGSNSEIAYALVQTADGGYALGGSSVDPVSWSFWLVKTDSSGNLQWNSTCGTASSQCAIASIIQTSDGGYTLLGTIQEFISSGSSSNMSIFKTNSSGVVQWTKNYYGASAPSMVQSTDGGYVLASSPGTFSLGTSISSILKTDSSGNLLWNTTFTRTGMTWLSSVIQSADGGYTELGETIYPQSSIWLQHTDSTGVAQWNATFSQTKMDIRDLLQASDGGYLIFGSYGSQFYLIKAVTSNPSVTTSPFSSSTPAVKILSNSTQTLILPSPPSTNSTITPQTSISVVILSPAPSYSGTDELMADTLRIGSDQVNLAVLAIAIVEAIVILILSLLLVVKRQNIKPASNADSKPSA